MQKIKIIASLLILCTHAVSLSMGHHKKPKKKVQSEQKTSLRAGTLVKSQTKRDATMKPEQFQVYFDQKARAVWKNWHTHRAAYVKDIADNDARIVFVFGEKCETDTQKV